MKVSKESEENHFKSSARTSGFSHKSMYESENDRRRREDRFDKDYLSEADLDKIQAIS